MRLPARGCAALCAALCASPAVALEEFGVYDAFSAPVIDASKWVAPERVRQLRNSSLNLQQRDWGGTSGNSGLVTQAFNTQLNNPGPISQLRAAMRVDAYELTACPGNPAPSRARARLFGTFFNTGTPVGGSFIGDVLVQVVLQRSSASAPSSTPLEAVGIAVVCQNADCSVSQILGSPIALGTAAVGQAVTLSIEWDRAGKRFDFGRDGVPNVGSVAYTVSDSAGPGSPVKAVGTRIEAANCASPPRPTGFINATFDTLEYNRSATR